MSRPQAISGVRTGENEIMTVYPSICSGGLGRVLGRLYDSIPVRIFGVKLSNLLFVLPTAPLAILMYAMSKLNGNRYVLTSDFVEIRKLLGSGRFGKVSIADVMETRSVQRPGQEFYHASDLELLADDGDTLLTLPGLPRSEVFGVAIMKAAQARRTVRQSLDAIEARKSA